MIVGIRNHPRNHSALVCNPQATFVTQRFNVYPGFHCGRYLVSPADSSKKKAGDMPRP
jgi:hypothetical protein